MAKPVEVRIWGIPVGVVAEVSDSRAYAFEYYPAWANRQIHLAPLTMPVGTAQTRRTWTFPDLGEGFQNLPGLLADALPDAFGNRLIDAWMAAHGVRPAEVTPLDRLAYMGKRGMGALEFHPPKGSTRESSKPLQMSALVDEARAAVTGDIGSPTATAESLRDIIRVGTSAGGARPKAVIALNPANMEIRSGQFDVPGGFEHWLLKFDGIAAAGADLGTPQGYGRIEFAYYQMAGAAGVEMAQCRLLEESGRAHFMTKRFDRSGNAKHHVQSLCALAHLDYKMPGTHAYEQLFIAMKSIGIGDAGLAQAFRRMVFNFSARNCDDHTKNFAFILKEGGRWDLAPAFDITHAYNPGSKWVAQHQMSVNGKFANVTRSDFLAVADRFSIPSATMILDEVTTTLAGWTVFARAAGVEIGETERIQSMFEPVSA